MRKLALLGLVVLLLPMLAACGPTVDSAKADFCSDLDVLANPWVVCVTSTLARPRMTCRMHSGTLIRPGKM